MSTAQSPAQPPPSSGSSGNPNESQSGMIGLSNRSSATGYQQSETTFHSDAPSHSGKISRMSSGQLRLCCCLNTTFLETLDTNAICFATTFCATTACCVSCSLPPRTVSCFSLCSARLFYSLAALSAEWVWALLSTLTRTLQLIHSTLDCFRRAYSRAILKRCTRSPKMKLASLKRSGSSRGSRIRVR